MLPCLHWSIKRSWGISFMFIKYILTLLKVSITTWLDSKKSKSFRRLFVMANQFISLLRSRGKHRCIYSSHFSDHSNPPPCITHGNTAAARVSCFISQTVHALSFSQAMCLVVNRFSEVWWMLPCTGTYGDSMLFLVCVIDSGGSKNKSHNATSAWQYASDLYHKHCKCWSW